MTGMLAAGLKIHHDYAVLGACHPAGATACLLLTDWFNTDWHLGNGIRIALTAFCLGTVIGRVLPAMAASAGCFAALAAVTVLYLQHHYPVSAFWPRQLLESGWLASSSRPPSPGRSARPLWSARSRRRRGRRAGGSWPGPEWRGRRPRRR